MTGLRPDGREMAEAITAALDEARLNPEDVDYVNAHGSGTKQNDRHETAAVKRSLGDHAYRIPMSSIKSMVGHSLGAIGSIEIAACALAMENDVVPPTANLHTPDAECDLDYVPCQRAAVADRHGPDGRQRLRRLPERDGPAEAEMSAPVPTAGAAPAPARAATARAVVTGIGVTAPNGLGTEAFWRNTLAGVAGIRPVGRFDAAGYPAPAGRRGPRLHWPRATCPAG